MKLDELIAYGWLKKISPSMERAKKSIEVARRFLDRAKRNREQNMDDMAVFAAYSACFHAARAILFCDGFAERSHLAV